MSLPSDAPRHVIALRKRIENVAGGDQARANVIVRTVTTVAVGQLLPPSAVKGGTAMKLRLGMDGSRFSTDLDLARRSGLEEFLTDFDQALREGWGGFAGEIRPSRSVSRPLDVPSGYVMTTRNIKVMYNNRDLMTIVLEIGHDELDDTLDPPTVLADDITNLFAAIGLPRPSPIPVVAHDHQIAQKLHAVSRPGSERAHDLVDLQLLEATSTFADDVVAQTCARLFTFRKMHTWPPVIEAGTGWTTIYAAAAEGLAVLSDLDAAISWVNTYIARLHHAHRTTRERH